MLAHERNQFGFARRVRPRPCACEGPGRDGLGQGCPQVRFAYLLYRSRTEKSVAGEIGKQRRAKCIAGAYGVGHRYFWWGAVGAGTVLVNGRGTKVPPR